MIQSCKLGQSMPACGSCCGRLIVSTCLSEDRESHQLCCPAPPRGDEFKPGQSWRRSYLPLLVGASNNRFGAG